MLQLVINRVMKALTHYVEVTRLEANMDKSSIFLAGVTDVVKTQLLKEQASLNGSFVSDT